MKIPRLTALIHSLRSAACTLTKPKPVARTGLGLLIALLTLVPAVNAAESVAPPAPFGPTPNARQLRWQGLKVYAFIHFGMNTFTNKEWGFGDESPERFNPTAFDADQIARTVKEAGFAGLIFTAKHHDGFCMWPSAYTEHSVKNSPWKQGKGDVVKELAEACKRQGILYGLYLSPWDRNRADYGQPEYVTYYHNQLRELLTNYGPIFELWFDGASRPRPVTSASLPPIPSPTKAGWLFTSWESWPSNPKCEGEVI